MPMLTALEIDAEREARRYIADVKQDIERMFSPSVIRQAHRQIEMAAASPGLSEVALLDRMIDLIVGRTARLRPHRVRHGADRPHAAAAADAGGDHDVDSGARPPSARDRRDRSRRRADGGSGGPGRSGAGGARAPSRARRPAAQHHHRPEAHVVRPRHASRTARDRGNGARRRSARRGRHRSGRAGHQSGAAGRPRRRVLPLEEGAGVAPISKRSPGDSSAIRGSSCDSSPETCTVPNRSPKSAGSWSVRPRS